MYNFTLRGPYMAMAGPEEGGGAPPYFSQTNF